MESYLMLEREYAKFTGSAYAVSCNSGTSALHLALLAMGVGKGDEVIVPDFTMAACAFAVSYTGATPVFADVRLDDYAIDPLDIEKRITKKTKVIMVVHVYGRLAPMAEILRIARKHKLLVLEDACEAHGAVHKSKADITIYSFYRNKIIHAEEGGMITTDSKRYVERCSYLKNMAFSKAHDYFHAEVGFNYRMANAQAELALKSLWDYEDNNDMRRAIESYYDAEFRPPPKKRDAVWFYEVAVRNKKKVLTEIRDARNCFKPLSTFPMYGSGPGRPNALALSKQLVLLPVRPGMTETDVKKICAKL